MSNEIKIMGPLALYHLNELASMRSVDVCEMIDILTGFLLSEEDAGHLKWLERK